MIAEYNCNHAQKRGQICCKSVQMVRGSSLQNDLLQNLYFNCILNALINIFLSFVAEIADNASLSCVEETGSSATESDSIGSLRNSSPENINTVASLTTLAGSCSSKDLGLSHKNKGISHGNRISSPSPRINR